LTQYRRVTDGLTDRRTDRHVAIAITRASKVKAAYRSLFCYQQRLAYRYAV